MGTTVIAEYERVGLRPLLRWPTEDQWPTA